MNIQIQTGDITDFRGDAIIIPCDCELTNKKIGIVGKILDKGGEGLIKELTAIGFCEIGSANITQGYELPTKNIIFMPIFDYTGDSESNYLGLHQSLRNAFILADLYQAKSIAFANISLPRKKKDFFKSLINKVMSSEIESEPLDTSGTEDIIISISKDFENSTIKKISIYKYSK